MKTLVALAILLLASSCNGECWESISVFPGDTCQSIIENNAAGISLDQFMMINPGLDCNDLQNVGSVCLYDSILANESGNGDNNGEVESSNGESENPSVEVYVIDPNEETNIQVEQGDVLIPPVEEVEAEASPPPEEEEVPSIEEEVPSIEEEVPSIEEEVPSIEEEVPSIEEEVSPEEENQNPSEEEVEEQSNIEYNVPYNDFIQEVIDAHQYYRNFFGSPRLVWNFTLNASAYSWAQGSAVNKSTHHSIDEMQARGLYTGYGECISNTFGTFSNATGTYGILSSATELIDGLGKGEWQKFINGSHIFDDSCSITGSWYDVGHFTQFIWKNTTSVGCGIDFNFDYSVLVCQYYPAGNQWLQTIY